MIGYRVGWQFSTGWNGVKLLRGLADVPSTTLVSDALGLSVVPTTMGRPDRAVAHHG